MDILEICNNYDSMRDGIGQYCKKVREEFLKSPKVENVYIETGYTNDSNRLRMILSMEMCRAFERALRDLKKHTIDFVIIEYPFQEYNPIILVQYKRLWQRCKKGKIKVVISVHEYLRASTLRRTVIDFMLSKADAAFVSDENTLHVLKKKSKNVFLRNMFGNVYPDQVISFEEKEDTFIYFGLVNRSKAFEKMLSAWNLFNSDNMYRMIIISSSDLSSFSVPEDSITIYNNLTESEIAAIMAKCRYAVLPILPEISSINGTFKTASLFGCICIGHFSDYLKNLEFIININNYDTECFAEGLRKAAALSEDKNREMFSKALCFGEKSTPANTAKEVLSALEQI